MNAHTVVTTWSTYILGINKYEKARVEQLSACDNKGVCPKRSHMDRKRVGCVMLGMAMKSDGAPFGEWTGLLRLAAWTAPTPLPPTGRRSPGARVA